MKMDIQIIPIVVSLDELVEVGGDGHDPPDKRVEYDVEYIIELRDIIDRLPSDIVRLGQKKVDGYPLTTAERKQLERFRKNHRNGGDENKF